MNKVILMGRLTRDPEVHYSQGETPIKVTNYTLAVKNSYSKNTEDNTDFIPVVAFGNQAEFAEKYLKKGRMIIISGRMHNDRWQDSEHINHSKHEVIVDNQEILDNKNSKKVEAEVQDSEFQVAIANEELPY